MNRSSLQPLHSKTLFSPVLDELALGVIVLNQAREVVLWNRWMEQHSSHMRESVIGYGLFDIFPELSSGRVAQAIQGVLQQGRAAFLSNALNPYPFPIFVSELERVKNERIRQGVSISVVLNDEGERGCLIQITDVTPMVKRENMLRDQANALAQKVEALTLAETQRSESEARFQKLAEVAPVGIFEIDAHNQFSYINPRLRTWCGLLPSENPTSLLHVVHEDDRENLINALNGAREYCCAHDGEIRLLMPDCTVIWTHVSATPIVANGHFTGFVGTVTDISERKALEIHHEYLAFHDALTGLPNRIHFVERLRTTIIQRQMEGSKLALLFLDLDKFKSINDTHGHSVGDGLLVAAAQRMLACVRSSDCVARLGGDEFVILLSNVPSAEIVVKIAEKLIDAMALPFELSGLHLRSSTSIGIAISPDDGRDVHDLLEKADAAMYVSKQSGRGRYRFHQEQSSAELPGSALYE